MKKRDVLIEMKQNIFFVPVLQIQKPKQNAQKADNAAIQKKVPDADP